MTAFFAVFAIGLKALLRPIMRRMIPPFFSCRVSMRPLLQFGHFLDILRPPSGVWQAACACFFFSFLYELWLKALAGASFLCIYRRHIFLLRSSFPPCCPLLSLSGPPSANPYVTAFMLLFYRFAFVFCVLSYGFSFSPQYLGSSLEFDFFEPCGLLLDVGAFMWLS